MGVNGLANGGANEDDLLGVDVYPVFTAAAICWRLRASAAKSFSATNPGIFLSCSISAMEYRRLTFSLSLSDKLRIASHGTGSLCITMPLKSNKFKTLEPSLGDKP